jgi:ribosomal protein S9
MVDPRYKSILEKTGLVGIDDRKKEAKKIGLYSARVRPPYVRRWLTTDILIINFIKQ